MSGKIKKLSASAVDLGEKTPKGASVEDDGLLTIAQEKFMRPTNKRGEGVEIRGCKNTVKGKRARGPMG